MVVGGQIGGGDQGAVGERDAQVLGLGAADELEAAIEAAEIGAALDRSEEVDVQRDASAVPVALNNAPEDLDAELTWLSTVAKYFKAARTRPSPAAARVASDNRTV